MQNQIDINLAQQWVDSIKPVKVFKTDRFPVFKESKVKALNETLRLLRVVNNVKVQEIASFLGLYSSRISEIERGQGSVTYKMLEGYSRFFGVDKQSIWELVEDLNQTKPTQRYLVAMKMAHHLRER